MTIVTNTFLTYAAVGNRENLIDTITNISPMDFPFMQAIGRGKATATTYEWQTDALASATADNFAIEGDDATFPALVATTRLNNTLQIMNKTLIVSGTQDVVNKAGRRSEYSYQVAKKAKELKRDMEAGLTGNYTQVAASSSGNTTARRMRPLCAWYSTNDVRGATGADGSTTQRATDGTQRALTEALFKTALLNAYTQGGDPNIFMVGPFNKQIASTFAGNATRLDKSEDKTLVAAVDVYKSDFGDIKIVPNRFSRERDGHVLDTEYWKMITLRPYEVIPLAKTGDADKALLQIEFTLESSQEAASAIVADLTTS